VSGPRFVDHSATTRVELSDDDWVDFRSELSYSEVQAIESGAILGKLDADRSLELEIDWPSYEVVRLSTWIVAWSFKDRDGLSEPPTKQAVRNLHPDTAGELIAALDAHIEKIGVEGKEDAAPS
jgi:hypothetical protein